MTEPTIRTLIIVWICIGVAVLPLTLVITAPFGRHASERFGPSISNRIGWLIMESPALWCFTLVFVSSVARESIAAWVFWALWMFHYIYRGVVFPIRIRTTGKTIPLLIVMFAFSFQTINGYFNGISLGRLGEDYDANWLTNINVWTGIAMFFVGWFIHFVSDERLLRLRSGDEAGYKIPHGNLFHWISCPNFLGEMIQWCGWALMCWNLAGFSFAVWTIANLLPRALAHHRWYKKRFAGYPTNRKAVFPGVL